jgi:hypothetical protein
MINGWFVLLLVSLAWFAGFANGILLHDFVIGALKAAHDKINSRHDS